MADRFTYGTGISRQPIDFVSGGQRLLESAVEQKRRDIESQRLQVSDSAKAIVDAMSVKTIDGLSRGLQDKYQQEIDTHRQKMIDVYKGSGDGKIPKTAQLEFQREFGDIQSKMLSDVQALKQRDTIRKLALDPNAKYAYDLPNMLGELSRWDKAFEKGEYLGDPVTIAFKHQIEPSVDDYISKQYQNAIDTLDVEGLGEFKGNVFTQTELSGLEVGQQKSIEKVRRLVDTMMEDPNIKNRYVASDGTVFEDEKAKVRQSIEDAISKKITEVKPYRQTTTGRKEFEPYVVEEKLEEIVPVEGGEISTYYKNSVPMSNVASFVFNGRKMAVESVGYAPVAKDKKAYDKWLSLKLDRFEQVPTLSKHGIIEKKYVDEYEGDIEYKPFAKVGTTKSKNPYASWEEMLGSSDPKDVKVDFLPFEGWLKGAIIAKTLTKKDAYESNFNELDSQMRG